MSTGVAWYCATCRAVGILKGRAGDSTLPVRQRWEQVRERLEKQHANAVAGVLNCGGPLNLLNADLYDRDLVLAPPLVFLDLRKKK